MSDLHYWLEKQEKNADLVIQNISKGTKLKEYPVFLLPYLVFTDKPTQKNILFKISVSVEHASIYKVYLFSELSEVRDYISNEQLFENTVNACEKILQLSDNELKKVFDKKNIYYLHSFLTLFDVMITKKQSTGDSSPNIFHDIINKFFDKQQDSYTLNCIEHLLKEEANT